MTTFLSVLALISSVTLIISVAMQEGAQEGAGMSSIASAPIWGKNKGIGKEYTLKRITIVAAVFFLITHLALTAI